MSNSSKIVRQAKFLDAGLVAYWRAQTGPCGYWKHRGFRYVMRGPFQTPELGQQVWRWVWTDLP